MIHAMIVDDEPLGQDGIRLRLETQTDVEVTGVYATAASAARAIKRSPPDVLFLDVQLPGRNGIELLRQVGVETVPVVVFVTAFNDYAIDAFGLRALDYLLKPYSDDRFYAVLERVRKQLALLRAGELADRVRALVPELLQASPTARQRIAIHTNDGVRILGAEQIEWVEAARDYVRVHTRGQSHLLRGGISRLGRRLDPQRFVRIHRSAIVNLTEIAEVRPLFRGEQLLILRSGTRLKVSRTYCKQLSEVLGFT